MGADKCNKLLMHFDTGRGNPYYGAPMLTTRLPTKVEPYRLASAGKRLEGVIPLANMPRVVEAIGAQEGDVSVSLSFDIDTQRRSFIEGSIAFEASLLCQRCLGPTEPEPLSSEFLLGLVTSDALAAQLPGEYEPVVVENEQLDLLSVIEDEVLLILPQVVYHEEADCAVSRDQLASGVEPEASDAPAVNPFSVLRTLKDKH